MKARIVDHPPEPRAPEDPKRVVRLYEQLRNVKAVARQLERGSQYTRGILREQGVELHNDGTRDPKTHAASMSLRFSRPRSWSLRSVRHASPTSVVDPIACDPGCPARQCSARRCISE